MVGGAFSIQLVSLTAAVVLVVLLLGAMAEDNDGDVDVVAVEVDIVDVVRCLDSGLEELPKLLMDWSLTLTVGNVVAEASAPAVARGIFFTAVASKAAAAAVFLEVMAGAGSW